MYTVVRVTGDAENLEKLAAVGESMNEVRPGIYEGIRRAGDGFACVVCDAGRWPQHDAAILKFVADFSAAFAQAAVAGGSITFDVAVEPEDRIGPILVVRGEASLLAALAERGIALEISIYP